MFFKEIINKLKGSKKMDINKNDMQAIIAALEYTANNLCCVPEGNSLQRHWNSSRHYQSPIRI